ncbi:MAG TPA: hypothetical protein DC031_01345 [Sulfitobacter sp.]|nr:hypothetical protein [Sulfitobacter sp.]
MLALGACARSGVAPGAAGLAPLPPRALAPCAHPLDFLRGGMSRAEFEIATGRMGDALISCGAEKQALGVYLQGLRDDFAGQEKEK